MTLSIKSEKVCAVYPYLLFPFCLLVSFIFPWFKSSCCDELLSWGGCNGFNSHVDYSVSLSAISLPSTPTWAGIHWNTIIFFRIFNCWTRCFICSNDISLHFICPCVVRQAWSAGIRTIHRPSAKRLHLIPSLDQALCRTRVEDIFIFENVIAYRKILYRVFQIYCQ